ncbi:MAG: OPT family oligopeptide transporter [Planctomycetota bacterium]|nr:OPT family oligopeptide transporter [Planctomycetota bacterium]
MASTAPDTPGKEGPPSDFGPGIPPVPENATPEQRDEHWMRHVYKGDSMPQLTVRAVVMGGLLGMAMAASNLYTTLAIGWAFGVAITACVMSFVIWNLVRLASAKRVGEMSILENACMASTASAAGYSTGSTIATMFGALLLLQKPGEGQTPADIASWDNQPVVIVAVFTLCTGLMGVFLAIPMKRQMINNEQLRFPSGIAAATTLRSLYSKSKEAVSQAYVLVAGMAAGFAIGILTTGSGQLSLLDKAFAWVEAKVANIRLPSEYTIPLKYHGSAPGATAIEYSGLLIAAGVIVRLRVALSMLAGSALLYFLVGPWLLEKDLTTPGSGWVERDGKWVYDVSTYVAGTVRNIDVHSSGAVLFFTRWSLWGGTSLMVIASLTALALNWRMVAKAFGGAKLVEGADGAPTARSVEVPVKWMIIGMIPVSIAMLIVQIVGFHISWWAGLIAIAMSFVLSFVASRATGETDTTPIGAMGKVMQLMFAIFHPGQVVPNLASAGVAANSASSSADLLTDLKTGYLLGANPRRQFLAQFFGVFFGTLAIVPFWFLMVPNQAALEKFAAPATRQWAAVAEVLTAGIDKLPESAKLAIVVGGLLGIALPIIERVSPAKMRKYLPSAMGLGLSWVVPFSNAAGFAIGAIIGFIWEKIHKKSADNYEIPVASGVIAGESLTKALIAMSATAEGLLTKK